MNESNQYREDSARLAALVERFTGIPKERAFHFILNNGSAELLSCANLLCDTEMQKERLTALLAFKSNYEMVKAAENNRAYQMNSAETSKAYFKAFFADTHDRERLAVAFLDVRCQLIAAKTLFTGTVGHSHVFPREIIKEALFHNASRVILAHNHPSGSQTPSQDDIAITGAITQGLLSVGIHLLDHIIVARDATISMVEGGYISTATIAPKRGKRTTMPTQTVDLSLAKIGLRR